MTITEESKVHLTILDLLSDTSATLPKKLETIVRHEQDLDRIGHSNDVGTFDMYLKTVLENTERYSDRPVGKLFQKIEEYHNEDLKVQNPTSEEFRKVLQKLLHSYRWAMAEYG